MGIRIGESILLAWEQNLVHFIALYVVQKTSPSASGRYETMTVKVEKVVGRMLNFGHLHIPHIYICNLSYCYQIDNHETLVCSCGIIKKWVQIYIFLLIWDNDQ